MRHRLAISRSAFLAICLLNVHNVRADVPEVPMPSPRARVEQRVGVTDFAVDYSSPAVKGRKVWDDLVPYHKVWRTGANAATKLTASHEFFFGDKKVPAGTYALFTIPTPTSWTVILNRAANDFGAFNYDEKQDVARLNVKPNTVSERERLTFIFTDTTETSSRLDLEWERVRISIPLKVDTSTAVMANIHKALDEAWRPHFVAARWLLDNGGNIDEALTDIDQSITLRATWWNTWVKAQLLGKKGRAADAIAAAEKAQELGKGDDTYPLFKDRVTKAISDWKKRS